MGSLLDSGKGHEVNDDDLMLYVYIKLIGAPLLEYQNLKITLCFKRVNYLINNEHIAYRGT